MRIFHALADQVDGFLSGSDDYTLPPSQIGVEEELGTTAHHQVLGLGRTSDLLYGGICSA